MTREYKIILVGATGRMGAQVVSACARASSSEECFVVLGGMTVEGDKSVGFAVPGVELPITSEWSSSFDSADVIVDFSSPAGTRKALESAARAKLPLLVCTTGLGAEFEPLFAAASKVVPVIRASNTSVGVNAMLKLVSQASKLLGPSFDVELVELHHRGKKDSPSGTAISLAQSIAKAKDVNLSDVSVQGRSGLSDGRRDEEIGIQAVRGGDVAGEHTVFFLGQGERLEITHRATNRAIFADGALRAVKWLCQQKESGVRPGLYSMLDVLGE